MTDLNDASSFEDFQRLTKYVPARSETNCELTLPRELAAGTEASGPDPPFDLASHLAGKSAAPYPSLVTTLSCSGAIYVRH